MLLLYISSTGHHAGQTLLTWAVARRLMEQGFAVGFFKPFGTPLAGQGDPWVDPDALLFKEVLKLEDSPDQLCPRFLSENAWLQKPAAEIMIRVQEAVQSLSAGKDVMLIMGSEQVFFDAAAHPVPDTSLIMGLGAGVILLDRCREMSTSIYSILSVCSLLGERVKGIILNRVPPDKLGAVQHQLLPSMTKRGIPILAVLPEDPILACRSVREVLEVLGGEILSGEEKIGGPVGVMTVGAAHLKGDLALFKRVYNKIVLLTPLATNGDSPGRDLIAGIILTGGRKPPPQVLEAVRKAQIPLLLIEHDTFAALDLLEKTLSRISPKDEGKVQRICDLLNRNGAFDKLLSSLSLPSTAARS